MKTDVLVPAEFTFPDTGKIILLNSSYFYDLMNLPGKHPMTDPEIISFMSGMSNREKYIFDTIITSRIFDGFYSVIHENPGKRFAEVPYFEMRSDDTINFLKPLDPEGVKTLCSEQNAGFIVSMEYFGFRTQTTRSYDDWENINLYLEMDGQVLWRIYNNKGNILSEYSDYQTLYWNSDPESDLLLPEITDAAREYFYLAGQRYALRICPGWKTISRAYYQIHTTGSDMSLDKEKLLSSQFEKNKERMYRIYYNLAVLSESEGNYQEALDWLSKAANYRDRQPNIDYRKKLEHRIGLLKLIEEQMGLNPEKE